MLPGTILYVVGTDAITQAIIQKRVPWPLISVIIGVGIILVILVKVARRRLHEEENEAQPAAPEESESAG